MVDVRYWHLADIKKVIRGVTQHHLGWLPRKVRSLEPSQKSSNQRYAQEQQKGFKDPHNPRVIVHPIVHQSPHLAPP